MRPIILAFLSLTISSVLAGPPFQARQTRLTVLNTVPGSETAVSVERVAGDHIAILGALQGTENRIRLYLLNGSASLIFSRPLSLNLPGDEFAGTLASLDQDRFLVTYVALSAGLSRTVIAAIRTNGDLLWQTQLPVIGNAVAFDRPPRAAAGDGGIVVVAYAAQGQTHIARLNSTGALLGESVWPGDDGTGSAPFGLEVRDQSIWVGIQNGLDLVSRYGLVKFNLNGEFLWARSQTQDVINILGPAWIRGLKDGTAVIVAGEEGPFGSHRTTITRYASDGTVLNRRMDPPANENNGGILLSASILPDGFLAYSMIFGSAPTLKVGHANGSVTWQNDLTGQLGASGGAFPATVDLDPETFRTAVLHDSNGFSGFSKPGAMFWNESLSVSGEPVRTLWTSRGTIVTVVNASDGVDQQIDVFARGFPARP